MYPKKTFLLLFIFSYILASKAQDSYYYYFIYLKDKQGSEFSITNPQQFLSPKAIARRNKSNITITEEDLPVSSRYLAEISAIGNCEVWNKSKWMNAVEVRFKDSGIINKISALPFVHSIQFLGKIKITDPPIINPVEIGHSYKSNNDSNTNTMVFTDKDYGAAFVQNSLININKLHNNQYKGNGISIAVLDAGFLNVYKTRGMNFDLDKLVVRDFVTHDNSVWEDDKHGTNVLSFMKTNDPGTYIGTAPLADYMLIRTEESSSEYPTEEVNWLAAAEFADSMGVDLISSSLGYNVFDDAGLSHTYRDLDGKTSIIAKAANIAHSKGIFVVVSAGNEGANKWHKIGTPSDATGVITIGATDAEGTHAEFSSYGPSSDGRIKPDFVVMGKKAIVASPGGTYAGNGTSYATPLFAGALACLMQACPNKSYDEITGALIVSSTHANTPDSAYGFGLPDMALAAAILGNYMDLDTSRDIFWVNPNASYWVDRNTHFRSSSDQTIEIIISGKKKNRDKVISKEKIILKKGEWLHKNDLHLLIAKQPGLKKRKQLKEITCEFISATSSFKRIITLK